jgi:hypothetical protein
MPATAAIIGAVGNVANGTLDTLNRNALYKAQIESVKVRDALATLDQRQKAVLDQQLLAAKTDSERFQILMDVANQVAIAGVKSTGDIYQEGIRARTQQNLTTAIIIIASLALLGGTLYLIKQKKI